MLTSQEEGQLIIHSTVNSGEKVLRSTRSDGKDLINSQLKEIQTDWDRLVKKIATSKVHIETSLLQWADYNSSYSHLEQWISDREAKLEEVCELKVNRNVFIIIGYRYVYTTIKVQLLNVDIKLYFCFFYN